MAHDTRNGHFPTLWQLLDLCDAQLERADVVAMNLAVARGIPGLSELDIGHYVRIVDDWTRQFARWLPTAELRFHKTPENWKNDIRFFRIGMLQGFLGHYIGIRYIEEQKNNRAIRYTNAADLFLNGLIDTRRGTCGNMAALHVAIARRLGWPVGLACTKSHLLSRFEDGHVTYNIEATSTHAGSFASDPDEAYIERFGLPQRAIACGSDLRKLTARETLGVFVGLRDRHHRDGDRLMPADSDYALSRVLFPNYRCAYVGAMVPMLDRGTRLFDCGEVGHPTELIGAVAPIAAADLFSSVGTQRDAIRDCGKIPDLVLRVDGTYMVEVPKSAVQFG